VFTRGEEGGGWWTSNRAELPTRVEVRVEQDTLTVHLEVNVTGQRMVDEDREHWVREVAALRAWLQGKDDAPRDLRPRELKRASERFRQTLVTGILGFFIAGFTVICIMLLLQLTGAVGS